MHKPIEDHWAAVKRILRYLKGTIAYNLCLRTPFAFHITAFADTGWASDSDDYRSQYGFAIYFGGCLVSWTSRKQKVVARSSTEAEYRAIAATVAELSFIQQLLFDLRQPFCRSLVLLCDNLSASFMARNPVLNNKSKHIHVDFHFVREKVEAQELVVQHVDALD